MNWTFWLNIVSPHLSAMLRALASMPDQTVTVVAEVEIGAGRRKIGWSTPDCSPARVMIKPQQVEIDEIIERTGNRQSVHILGGLQRGTLNRQVLSRLAKTGAIVAFSSETADDRGILGLARRAKYSLDRYFVEDNLDFVLGVGEVGVRWYAAAGYNPARIFPFLYVTEKPGLTSESDSGSRVTDKFRLLYLGQFIPRKDGVTAIRALAKLRDLDWQFDAVGSGPDLGRWKKTADASGVANRIRFLPAVDNRNVGELLQATDILLLPSRYDGWGAVVNEALMCGVPVVCSDNCGAADLLREPWRGSTFKAGSVESLTGVLERWIKGGKRGKESTARVQEWSSVLEGPRIASYLVEVVNYVRDGGERPSPPWY